MSSVVQDKLQAARKARPVHIFEVPQSVPSEIRTLGVVELTANEELQATRRVAGDQFRLAYELALASLVEVDGQAVKLSDGTADKAFNDMGPRGRQLLMQAYHKVNGVEQEQTASFLSSQKIRLA